VQVDNLHRHAGGHRLFFGAAGCSTCGMRPDVTPPASGAVFGRGWARCRLTTCTYTEAGAVVSS